MIMTISPRPVKAIGPELFAAIPLSWPVIVTVLVAMGIGTAAYYSTLDAETKENIQNKITNALDSAGETLNHFLDPVYMAVGIVNAGQYIRGIISGDKSYLTKNQLDIIADSANELGLLGGEKEHINDLSQISINTGTDFNSISRFPPRLLTSTYTRNWGTSNQMDKVTEILNNVSDSALCAIGSSGTEIVLFVSTLADGNHVATSFSYWGTNANIKIVRFTGTSNNDRYFINSSGNISSEYHTTDNFAYYGTVNNVSSGWLNLGNVGNYTIDNYGTPEGPLGQVSENNIDNWSYPWSAGIETVIDNIGDALSISIADALGDMVITWDPSIDYPYSLSLPDVATAIDDPAEAAADQAAAQAGTVDLADAIPAEAGVTPIFGNLLLPDWALKRFPFCIVTDLAFAANLLDNASDEPPVLDFSWMLITPLGDFPIEATFDMSYFNDLMPILRNAQIMLFIIALAYHTRIFFF